MYPCKYIVDISKNTCTCGSWALFGISCVHALIALGSAGKNIEDFVHSCYNMTSFALAYEPSVLPINGPDLWPQSNRDTILPPPYRKQPVNLKREGGGNMMSQEIPIECRGCMHLGNVENVSK